MARRRVIVRAPSRLHFGMFSFGRQDVRQFGGLGVMIDEPELVLTIDRDETLSTEPSPLAETMLELAQRVATSLQLETGARLHLERGPRRHAGLGSGTQLGMAIAAGLSALAGLPTDDPPTLARACGRGERSSVGLYGFVHGGFIAEAGKLEDEEISPLLNRVELPAAWRFVLLHPSTNPGLSGDAERLAFARMPPVPRSTTSVLSQIAFLELVPAALRGNFEAFALHLTHFNRTAGACFATEQGGEFADGAVRDLVHRVRRCGVDCVVQSSWGPTVAALVPHDEAAQKLVQRLRESGRADDLELTITAVNNRGARIETIDD